MKYKQVIVCALGLLVGMTQLVWGEFNNPTEDKPDGKGDGGNRGRNNYPELCLQMEKPFLALIPKTNSGYTLASHPTFWLYIPGLSDSIYFTLKDKDTGEEIYQTKFNVESEQGIISLKLPSAAPRLKVGKEYRWRFVFNCSRTYAKTPYIAHNNFDELHYSHVRSPNYFYSKTFSFSSQITFILIEGCFNSSVRYFDNNPCLT